MGHILRKRSVGLGHSSFLEAFYPPATLLILFSLQFRCISCSVAGFHTSARGSGPFAESSYFFLACSSGGLFTAQIARLNCCFGQYWRVLLAQYHSTSWLPRPRHRSILHP